MVLSACVSSQQSRAQLSRCHPSPWTGGVGGGLNEAGSKSPLNSVAWVLL